jgi:hypothetical protein
LPPKIEALDSDEEEDSEENENPTVVIDSSMDDRDLVAEYREMIDEVDNEGVLSNMQAAMKSL